VEHELVVKGSGEVRVMPDRASVRIMVDGEGRSRDDAYTAAARAASAVDGVLHTEAGALERVTTAALVVQPRTRWQDGEAVRTGWTAYRGSVLEVRALERLGDLLAQLAASGAAISGVTWELDSANAAHDQARTEAGRDARRRAERYAQALGVRLGAVAWIAEPGLRLPGTQPAPAAFAATARAAAPAAPGGADTIAVAPEQLTVTASIEVGFTIVADDLK
jgi:uncharacterized protein YggE